MQERFHQMRIQPYRNLLAYTASVDVDYYRHKVQMY